MVLAEHCIGLPDIAATDMNAATGALARSTAAAADSLVVDDDRAGEVDPAIGDVQASAQAIAPGGAALAAHGLVIGEQAARHAEHRSANVGDAAAHAVATRLRAGTADGLVVGEGAVQDRRGSRGIKREQAIDGATQAEA